MVNKMVSGVCVFSLVFLSLHHQIQRQLPRQLELHTYIHNIYIYSS